MFRILLLILCLVTGPATAVWAHPPRDMKLSYDAKTKILTVTMTHVSQKLRKHYIRTLAVAVNQNQPQIFRYTSQREPANIEFDVRVEAAPGDLLTVTTDCNEGGSLTGTLKLPEEEKPTETKK